MLGLLAQTEPSATAEYFGSIAGIVVATVTLVAILRKAFAQVPAFNKVPVWLYAVGAATGLTAVAVYGLKTMEGNFMDLALQTVILAASASGFREWVKDANVTPATIAKKANVILLTGCLLLFAGCKQTTPADWQFLDASERYHKAVGGPFIEYVNSDESLTPTQKEGRITAHLTYGKALEARRTAMSGTTVIPVE